MSQIKNSCKRLARCSQRCFAGAEEWHMQMRGLTLHRVAEAQNGVGGRSRTRRQWSLIVTIRIPKPSPFPLDDANPSPLSPPEAAKCGSHPKNQASGCQIPLAQPAVQARVAPDVRTGPAKRANTEPLSSASRTSKQAIRRSSSMRLANRSPPCQL